MGFFVIPLYSGTYGQKKKHEKIEKSGKKRKNTKKTCFFGQKNDKKSRVYGPKTRQKNEKPVRRCLKDFSDFLCFLAKRIFLRFVGV